MWVVSVSVTEFSAQPPVRYLFNSTAGAYSAYFSPWTNDGGHNARRGRYIQQCHLRGDISDRLQTGDHVPERQWESRPRQSELNYGQGAKLMEYRPCSIWYLNIQSETIKQWPTLLLFMEFWDFWSVPSVEDSKKCGLANCDESHSWILTSSHSDAGIPLTQWLVLSDDVVVFWCNRRSRECYCDRTAWCRVIVFHCEKFDAYYLDRRHRSSIGCAAQDDADC